MKSNTSIRLAWLAAIACVGCCAIIPLMVLLGFAGLAGLAWYFDIAAIGFLLASISLFFYAVYRKNCSARNGVCAAGAVTNKEKIE